MKRFEMQSAKINASISGSITADSNAQPNGDQGGLENMGKKAVWGPVQNPAQVIAPYEDPGYSVREIESGGYVVQNFTPGYKYTEHKTDRPNVKIPEFIEKNLKYTHPANYGISTNLVSMDFEGSYNASKGKIDVSWKTGVEYFLKQFSSDFDKPIYKLWLNGKVATGEIVAPGWEDVRKRAAWSSMSVIVPAKPSLNPLQEAKAGTERLKEGISNRELESQQQTGTSAEENAERLLPENERLAIARAPIQELENPAPDEPEKPEDLEDE